MSGKGKRKVQFSEFDEENKKQRYATTDTRLHSGKHTLESDEEDEDHDEEKPMNDNELDGWNFPLSIQCLLLLF